MLLFFNLHFFFVDKSDNVVTFSSISETGEVNLCPNFSYDVELEQYKYLKICIGDIELAESKSSDWLVDKLFTKLIAWAEKVSENLPKNKSLSLIPVEEYYEMYSDLKEKYGEKMLQVSTEDDSILLQFLKQLKILYDSFLIVKP